MNIEDKPMVNSPIGLTPGEPVFVGERKVDEIEIRLIEYDESNFSSKTVTELSDLNSSFTSEKITWMNVSGIHDPDIIQKILMPLNLHNLVIEDILNTQQRTKIESYEDYHFIVVKTMNYDMEKKTLRKEQISLIFGKNYVCSFCERKIDIFNPLIERISMSKGRIRKSGADYLTFAILDIVVDNYYNDIELINDEVEDLEESIFSGSDDNVAMRIHNLKRQLISFRRSTVAFRELLGELLKEEHEWVSDQISPFFRDVFDHIVFINGTIELHRDLVSGLMDFHLSMVSNRMNEVMKVLTIIATIFIPLSFIAGIYGMNFEFMPELSWSWGYPLFWLIILSITSGLLFFFKKRKWF